MKCRLSNETVRRGAVKFPKNSTQEMVCDAIYIFCCKDANKLCPQFLAVQPNTMIGST